MIKLGRYYIPINLIFNLRFLILTFFLTLAIGVFCQISIKGKILDSSSMPLPYVNMVSLNNINIGTTSNENGEYVLNAKNKYQPIKISCIGYEDTVLIAGILLENPEVTLKKQVQILQEINVYSNYITKNIEVTDFSKKWSQGYIFGSGFMIASRINNKEHIKNGYLSSISFILAKMGKYHHPIRLKFLESNKYDIPGKDLLNKEIVIKSNNKDKIEILTVDLSLYNISFPENGCYAVLEWIDTARKNNNNYFSYTWVDKDFLKNDSEDIITPSPILSFKKSNEGKVYYTKRNGNWIPFQERLTPNILVKVNAIKSKAENN